MAARKDTRGQAAAGSRSLSRVLIAVLGRNISSSSGGSRYWTVLCRAKRTRCGEGLMAREGAVTLGTRAKGGMSGSRSCTVHPVVVRVSLRAQRSLVLGPRP